MMWRLVVKDLTVQKRNFIIIVFLSLAISGIMPNSPGTAGIQLLLGVYLMLVYANSYDFKYNGEIMINSLPISRKEIVLAKYLSAFVYALIIMIIVFPLSFVLKILDFPGLNTIGIRSLAGFLIIGIFFLSIYISIYLPLYYKLGYMNSRWANFISLFVIFGLVGFLGDITKDYQGNFSASPGIVEIFFGILTGQGTTMAFQIMALLSIILVLISMRISVWIYRNKDL